MGKGDLSGLLGLALGWFDLLEFRPRFYLNPKGKSIRIHGFFPFGLEFFDRKDAVLSAANMDSGFIRC